MSKNKLLAAAAILAASALPANASLVLFDNPFQTDCTTAACESFVEIGGTGFGAAPRMLTLQTTPLQEGSGVPDGATGTAVTGDAIAGDNKTNVLTLGSLGWTAGSFIAVGYDSNQTGGNGITLNELTLNLYDASNVLQASFSTAAPITFTEDDLDLQQGTGTAIFAFVLDAAQRLQFNLLNPTTAWKVGLFASMGCTETSPTGCLVSDDGPDSFLAIAAGNPIINPLCTTPGGCEPSTVPVPGAVWLFGTTVAIAGGMRQLLRLRRRREQRAAA